MPETLEPIEISETELNQLILGETVEIIAIGKEQNLRTPIQIKLADIGIERIQMLIQKASYALREPEPIDPESGYHKQTFEQLAPIHRQI